MRVFVRICVLNHTVWPVCISFEICGFWFLHWAVATIKNTRVSFRVLFCTHLLFLNLLFAPLSNEMVFFPLPPFFVYLSSYTSFWWLQSHIRNITFCMVVYEVCSNVCDLRFKIGMYLFCPGRTPTHHTYTFLPIILRTFQFEWWSVFFLDEKFRSEVLYIIQTERRNPNICISYILLIAVIRDIKKKFCSRLSNQNSPLGKCGMHSYPSK